MAVTVPWCRRTISLFANAVPVGTLSVAFSLPMATIGAMEGGFAGELQEVRARRVAGRGGGGVLA